MSRVINSTFVLKVYEKAQQHRIDAKGAPWVTASGQQFFNIYIIFHIYYFRKCIRWKENNLIQKLSRVIDYTFVLELYDKSLLIFVRVIIFYVSSVTIKNHVNLSQVSTMRCWGGSSQTKIKSGHPTPAPVAFILVNTIWCVILAVPLLNFSLGYSGLWLIYHTPHGSKALICHIQWKAVYLKWPGEEYAYSNYKRNIEYAWHYVIFPHSIEFI